MKKYCHLALASVLGLLASVLSCSKAQQQPTPPSSAAAADTAPAAVPAGEAAQADAVGKNPLEAEAGHAGKGRGRNRAGAAQAEKDQGHISLSEGKPSHDFGKLRQGELGTHDFLFVSDGEEALVINSVKSSCGCTKAGVMLVGAEGTRTAYTPGDPIPAGTRFVLESEVDTAGIFGPFSVQISIYANDLRSRAKTSRPDPGSFNLRLKAEIEPVLTVSPSSTVSFGRITTTDRVTQTVTVSSTRGEAFMLSLGQGLDEPLAVEFAAKNPDAEGRASEWEIHATLGPNTPIGMRNYPIHFVSDLPMAHPKVPSQDGSVQNYSVVLNLQAQVKGFVSAEPSLLMFGMVRPGEPFERVVQLESHGDFRLRSDMPVTFEGLPGQEFPPKELFHVTIESLEGGQKADVKVRLEGLPEDLKGSFGGVLKIQVGHPQQQELLLRFSGVCRPLTR